MLVIFSEVDNVRRSAGVIISMALKVLLCMQAFDIATSQFGVPKVLEAADMVLRKVPDRLSVMTYLFQLRAYFSREEECHETYDVDGGDSMSAADSDNNTRLSADSTSTDCQQPLNEQSVSNCSS